MVVLSSRKDHNPPVLEEGKVRRSIVQEEEVEVNIVPREKYGTTISEIPCIDAILQEKHDSPTCATPSPYYAEIIKKKLVDMSGSSEEDSIEKITKKASRKSRKEVREEETERLNMQGS